MDGKKSENSSQTISGPPWDNTSEYSGIDAAPFKADFGLAIEKIAIIDRVAKLFDFSREQIETLVAAERDQLISQAQEVYKPYEDAGRLLWNLMTFVHCMLSVDGKNTDAQRQEAEITATLAKLNQHYKPIELFLKHVDNEGFEKYLDTDLTSSQRFHLSQERLLKDFSLTKEAEELLVEMEVNGKSAFSTLYNTISGSLECEISSNGQEQKNMGIAEASALLENPDRELRKSAYLGIKKAWSRHQDTCSAALNGISGWRIAEYNRRSFKRPMDCLEEPLHQGRLQRSTLASMMDVVRSNLDDLRESITVQARVLGLERLAPWDLFAPPTVGGSAAQSFKFSEAIDLICEAFSYISDEMVDFVQKMVAEKWIEGTVGPNKRPGAYATEFMKSRNPRVYMTFAGGMKDVKTLAHELGHAFHSWSMRDMPISQTVYPMTLAETASIFAETVVSERMISQSKDDAEKLRFLFTTAKEIEGLLINVPARFDFERRLYEARATSSLTASDLNSHMASVWRDWYGESLSEVNESFWVSKLHFYIDQLSFYNFPYTFGYLFALGVFSQREQLGAQFFDSYKKLLRDTGSMTVEDLARKHLDVDLTKGDFWQQSVDIALNELRVMATLAKKLENP